MKIYTKVGDQGQTRLVGGSTVDKSDLRLETYGTLDELNSSIGFALCLIPQRSELSYLKEDLIKIQHHLFDLGSHLACEDEATRSFLPGFDESRVNWMEIQIDAMTAELPPLKEFILPGGHSSAAALHISRTICRRAERLLVKFSHLTPHATHSLGIKYINRLSDFLFTAARYCNLQSQTPEPTWKKGVN